ncbi:MAG: quinoprotein relay system zinc metallohydrolase 2 [Thiotrichales bacterium]
MIRTHLALTVVAVACLWFALAAAGTAAPCEHPAPVREIAPGNYLRAGHAGVLFEQREIANAGFIVGNRCVAVIDSGGSPDEGAALRCAIASVTNTPICYVINTHDHPDHTLGNIAFRRPGTAFVGHHQLPRALAMLGPTYIERANALLPTPLPIDALVSPDQLVHTTTRLDLGDRSLMLAAHPKAHTDNDLTVFDPLTGTFWAGDLLFIDHIPVLGGSGSATGWIELTDTVAPAPIRLTVPGHGPPQRDWAAANAPQLRYLKALRDDVRAWIARDGDLAGALVTLGVNPDQTVALFNQYHRRNVSYVYRELEWE